MKTSASNGCLRRFCISSFYILQKLKQFIPALHHDLHGSIDSFEQFVLVHVLTDLLHPLLPEILESA
jgi:hypothetical protein